MCITSVCIRFHLPLLYPVALSPSILSTLFWITSYLRIFLYLNLPPFAHHHKILPLILYSSLNFCKGHCSRAPVLNTCCSHILLSPLYLTTIYTPKYQTGSETNVSEVSQSIGKKGFTSISSPSLSDYTYVQLSTTQAMWMARQGLIETVCKWLWPSLSQ